MSDIRARLAQSFSAVFPELPHDKIEAAAPSSVSAWDSLATVTLFAVVEEEFGVALDIDELGADISFATILAFLRQRQNQPA